MRGKRASRALASDLFCIIIPISPQYHLFWSCISSTVVGIQGDLWHFTFVRFPTRRASCWAKGSSECISWKRLVADLGVLGMRGLYVVVASGKGNHCFFCFFLSLDSGAVWEDAICPDVGSWTADASSRLLM